MRINCGVRSRKVTSGVGSCRTQVEHPVSKIPEQSSTHSRARRNGMVNLSLLGGELS